MRQLLLGVFVLAGCTLISDADQFVGEGDAGADDGGQDSGPPDSGTADTGPFMEGSCAAQVSGSADDWTLGRCCFAPDHCAGMMVRGIVDDGRCLMDNCGDLITPLAAICIPSAATLRVVFGENSCYWDDDCPIGQSCMLGATGQYRVATCPDMPPPPGVCTETR